MSRETVPRPSTHGKKARPADCTSDAMTSGRQLPNLGNWGNREKGRKLHAPAELARGVVERLAVRRRVFLRVCYVECNQHHLQYSTAPVQAPNVILGMLMSMLPLFLFLLSLHDRSDPGAA